MKLHKLPLIMLVATLVACGDEMGPDPQSLLGPDVASYAKGGKSEEARAGKPQKKEPKVRGRNKKGQEKEFQVARRRGANSEQVASAWISSDGGTVRLGNHTLTVPAGAVDKPTRFSMREAEHQLEGEEVLALDLNATVGSGAHTTDVGAAGFKVPVQLCIGSADAEDFVASSEYVLIWLRGSVKVLDVVDASASGAQVCGDLDHFSLWALGWP